MTSIRTFIAFDTPERIKKKMSEIQTELKKSNADIKWEDGNKFHTTIKFLGDVDETILPQIIGVTEQAIAGIKRFDVAYSSLGCFPNKRRPRVIWIGCENAGGTVNKLKGLLDQSLQPVGFEVDDRAFHPHITLGRVRTQNGVQNLISMLESLTFEPQGAIITDIAVMKSVLRHGGSEYTILKSIKLKE